MSSDTSFASVLAVDGPRIDLRVRTTSAGGLDDYSCTRSFALTLLADARRRARDLGFPEPPAIAGLALEQKTWPDDWYTSESFMTESAGRYVEKTACTARRNVFGDAPDGQRLLSGTGALMEVMGLDARRQEPFWLEVSHAIDLAVTMTDARWLAGLEAGLVIPSTAYDVWWNDPLRPELPAGTSAPSPRERWRVYTMDEKYWAVRLRGASHTVQYGKLGTSGQTKTKELSSDETATRDVARLLREKTGKGYEPVDDEESEDDLDA